MNICRAWVVILCHPGSRDGNEEGCKDNFCTRLFNLSELIANLSEVVNRFGEADRMSVSGHNYLCHSFLQLKLNVD